MHHRATQVAGLSWLAASWVGLLAAFLLNSASYAAMPEKTQVIQAELMTLSGDGWTVREHSPDNWYAGRPVGQMLGGQNQHAGTATATFRIPAAGKYRIWVRYLDMVHHRSRSGFHLSAIQKNKQVAQKSFDDTETSPRSTPEGAKKWGEGFARWSWDFVELDAAAGGLLVAATKVHLTSVHGCTRTLDLLLLTDDLAYEPVATDLMPLYVKVRRLPEQKEPVVVHFWGRRPFSPWYTPHANINRKGLFLGVSTGSEDMPGIRVAAGEGSPWVDTSPYLAYGGLNKISLYAMRSYHKPEPEAYFQVSFSKTPSEAGLIGKAERKGTGDGLIFAVDLVDYRLITAIPRRRARPRSRQGSVGCPS